MQQVAVRGVDLDGVEPDARGAPRSHRKRIAHALQSGAIERHRRQFARPIGIGGWRYGRPATLARHDLLAAAPRHVARRLAPGMRKLDRQRHRRMAAHRCKRPAERAFALVRPQPEIVRRDAPFRLDGGRLDDQQAGAGQREVAEVDQVPVGRQAVFGRVLAHRRNDDAVVDGKLADAER